jgi:hypothetical protein
MGEPVGSGGGRERVYGARRHCGDQHRPQFYAQDFGDHGGDHVMRPRCDFDPRHSTLRVAAFARRPWKARRAH